MHLGFRGKGYTGFTSRAYQVFHFGASGSQEHGPELSKVQRDARFGAGAPEGRPGGGQGCPAPFFWGLGFRGLGFRGFRDWGFKVQGLGSISDLRHLGYRSLNPKPQTSKARRT